ncbi:RIO1 family regulatory kinase/ATPase domain-containing protein [Streptosporangium roseum]|uniref:RIO1 family regulatory kinase/ATPase domain-containing protein n=1 Tax=Streptosporangium roseum TaxID=2001 RepID=UPI0033204364
MPPLATGGARAVPGADRRHRDPGGVRRQPRGFAAPRLAAVSEGLAELWEQLVDAMVILAREGLAHGDLSPYNILVHEGRLVIIDLPQIVDVVAHPTGPEFLDRDARNVATWFTARGLAAADGASLAGLLRAEAGVD